MLFNEVEIYLSNFLHDYVLPRGRFVLARVSTKSSFFFKNVSLKTLHNNLKAPCRQNGTNEYGHVFFFITTLG